MPDRPDRSCCNKGDCYPTEVRIVDGDIFAKRREDGKFIAVPATKVERNRDNPDGRNHICAPTHRHAVSAGHRVLLYPRHRRVKSVMRTQQKRARHRFPPTLSAAVD
jgi:hypothetical protein